jgi:hypothetical protein
MIYNIRIGNGKERENMRNRKKEIGAIVLLAVLMANCFGEPVKEQDKSPLDELRTSVS